MTRAPCRINSRSAGNSGTPAAAAGGSFAATGRVLGFSFSARTSGAGAIEGRGTANGLSAGFRLP